MAEKPESLNGHSWNHFNYFTEVEEHFQRARGTGLFLMSPLDWALVESWKTAGIPLEAVLRGIDQAFSKQQSRKKLSRSINSVAYCTQAVQEEADVLAGSVPVRRDPPKAPFTLEELAAFIGGNAEKVGSREGFESIATGLGAIASDIASHYEDLEELERRLTTLEEKMAAIVRTRTSDEELLEHRRQLDASLRPYRGKMSVEQLERLERQYLDRRIQEQAGLPRLSLFYLK